MTLLEVYLFNIFKLCAHTFCPLFISLFLRRPLQRWHQLQLWHELWRMTVFLAWGKRFLLIMQEWQSEGQNYKCEHLHKSILNYQINLPVSPCAEFLVLCLQFFSFFLKQWNLFFPNQEIPPKQGRHENRAAVLCRSSAEAPQGLFHLNSCVVPWLFYRSAVFQEPVLKLVFKSVKLYLEFPGSFSLLDI